ncbi:MAG: hypothetical protein O7D91_21600 [Planctomycetota bacterium]|nr:hypothetical protein [Planctomycetota bacterium]
MKVTIVIEANELPRLASALAIAVRSINLNDPRYLPKSLSQDGEGWSFKATIDIPAPVAEPAAKQN